MQHTAAYLHTGQCLGSRNIQLDTGQCGQWLDQTDLRMCNCLLCWHNADARGTADDFADIRQCLVPNTPSDIQLVSYAVLTCQIKLLQNYSAGLLQLTNIFQHVHCRRNNFRTPLAAEIIFFQFQTWLQSCETSGSAIAEEPRDALRQLKYYGLFWLSYWQEALLIQRNHASTVSWNRVKCCTNIRRIACENVCNRWMTFKVIQGHCRCHYLIGHILFPISLP